MVAGCLCAVLMGCSEKEASFDMQPYENQPLIRPVSPLISEASGIADSKANPGFLWVQEDSGNAAVLYLVGHDGQVAKTIPFKGITNRDWEDLVLSGNDLYLADIGDNAEAYKTYTIYKFPEPKADTDTIRTIEKITFQYSDGAHDAEAFLVDPESKDIYLLTKRDFPARIYKIAYPYSTTSVNTAVKAGALAYGGVVSAALSADGKGIIVKTYMDLFYYPRTANEPLEQALAKSHTKLPYVMEPQGEAVTFLRNNKGYFTLSEKFLSSKVDLYLYKKK